MTVTTTSYGRGKGAGWRRGDGLATTTVAWTSDASGDASEAITGFDGLIWRVVAVPGATTPSDQYDVSIVDDDSVNVIVPELNASSTAAQQLDLIETPCAHYGTLTVTIANAGNAKTGEVIIYWGTP